MFACGINLRSLQKICGVTIVDRDRNIRVGVRLGLQESVHPKNKLIYYPKLFFKVSTILNIYPLPVYEKGGGGILNHILSFATNNLYNRTKFDGTAWSQYYNIPST